MILEGIPVAALYDPPKLPDPRPRRQHRREPRRLTPTKQRDERKRLRSRSAPEGRAEG
jgi:hypothetical protein